MNVSWRILTPRHLPGAVAIIELEATHPADLDATLDELGVGSVDVETAPLRNIAGIDTGLVARWSPTMCHLMIHGGPALASALSHHLMRMGLSQSPGQQRFVEAANLLEQRLLHNLAIAASPLAVDLLMEQPRRWGESPDHRKVPAARDRRLRRLIHPPLVVAMGPPNIGKSSLLNALADRPVAAVADEPGTTRDHVGASIDLAGLVVRYIDTPGVRAAADEVEAQAISGFKAILPEADLILLCGDFASSPEGLRLPEGVSCIRVGLRADLGAACFAADVCVSIHDAESLSLLVRRIRDALVPSSDLFDPDPWVFWDPSPDDSPV